MQRLLAPFVALLLLCTSSKAASSAPLLSIGLRKVEESEAFQKFQLTISNKSSLSLGYSGEGDSPQVALEVFVDGKWERSVPCPHGAPQHVLKPKSAVTMYLLLPPSASGRIRVVKAFTIAPKSADEQARPLPLVYSNDVLVASSKKD